MRRKHRSKSARVKLYDDHDGICHICELPIAAGQAWDWSHLIDLAAGGEDTVENSAPAHRKCHRGKGSHTATVSQPRIAKTKRQRARHIGADQPKQKIQGRGFQKRSKRGRIELPTTLPQGSAQLRAMMEKQT